MIRPPVVSVLMAAYNSEKYIGEAIESVMASSFTDFELIICDDLSTDKTAAIAYSWQQKDRRVKVYVNETNLGDYPNRNKAASYAIGKYLKYLDHDDIIYPWGLEAMVKCIEQYPEAGFGIISYGLPQQSKYPILVTPADGYRAYFFKGVLFGMGPTGAIFRASAFQNVNGFSGKPFVGDTEMWLVMGRIFSFVRMPLDLVWYRQHDIQESKREKKDSMAVLRRFSVSKDALTNSNCPLPDAERKIALRNHYNLRIRKIILENLFKLKFASMIAQLKSFGFNFFDVLKALLGNKNPYHLR